MNWLILKFVIAISLIFTGSTVAVTAMPPVGLTSLSASIVQAMAVSTSTKPTEEPTKPQTPINTIPEVNPNASFMEVHAPVVIAPVVVKSSVPTSTATTSQEETLMRLPEKCLYGAYEAGGVETCRLPPTN